MFMRILVFLGGCFNRSRSSLTQPLLLNSEIIRRMTDNLFKPAILRLVSFRGGGGSNEVWDRETMFSQLAKRSICGLVSGLPRRGVGGGVFSHDLNFGFEPALSDF